MTKKKQKLECSECQEKVSGPLYNDPRDPPLEEGPCLCLSCVTWITEDEAEEHRETARQLDADVKKFKELKKKALYKRLDIKRKKIVKEVVEERIKGTTSMSRYK